MGGFYVIEMPVIILFHTCVVITGGFRKLSYRKTIPVIDLSQWIIDTFSEDDYIIFKLDVEGAEYEILRKMLNDKAFAYIDK